MTMASTLDHKLYQPIGIKILAGLSFKTGHIESNTDPLWRGCSYLYNCLKERIWDSQGNVLWSLFGVTCFFSCPLDYPD